MKKMRNKKGFTLVEIIVVLVILAILAAASIPTMLGFVNDARQKAHIADARALMMAAQMVVTEDFAAGKTVTGELGTDGTFFSGSAARTTKVFTYADLPEGSGATANTIVATFEAIASDGSNTGAKITTFVYTNNTAKVAVTIEAGGSTTVTTVS